METDPTRRRQIAASAGHDNDETTARSYLTDPAGIVRATALGALARMGAATIADVEHALLDSDATVRRRACAVAIPLQGVDLVPLLADADASVVEQAAWALGERGTARDGAVEALCRIVTTCDDALCREAAVAALGAIGDQSGLGAILHATRDKPAVRRRAIIALAPFEGPEVEMALQRAKEDRDWQVRQAAEDLS